MSDSVDTAAPSQSAATPGQILRRAREAQGIELDSLAAMLKISPRRLRALEADRYEELQGPTFVRALALTACRALKVDPNLLLDELPKGFHDTLIHVDGGLNAPFRPHHGTVEGAGPWSRMRLGHWLGLGLVLAAAAMWWLPQGDALQHWLHPDNTGAPPESALPTPAPAPELPLMNPLPKTEAPSAPAVSTPVNASQASTLPVATPQAQGPVPNHDPASAVAMAAGSSGVAMALGAAPLVVKARDVSWVEVIDSRNQVLLARNLAAGEWVPLTGAFPLRVRVGNVQATELLLRGKPLDIASASRDNVAKLEIN